LTSICKQLGIKESEIVSAEQVHGDGIAIASKRDRGRKISKVDALITGERDVPLSVRTADCAPILIFDPIKNILALVHSGRKGTEKELAYQTVQKMGEEFGSTPKDLTAKIGPCIGKCCYPVDLKEEILKQFDKAGVPEERVEIDPECTCCNKDKYFSYRGEGPKTGRMFLVATLGEP
jgi:YfiH family protein